MIKLKDIYLFQNLDSEFINLVVDNSRRVEFSQEEIIISEGDISNGEAYIIQEGQVAVHRNGELISSLEAPDIFGEIALITDEPRTATVEATTNVIALKINKKLLFNILKDFNHGDRLKKIIQDRIIESVKK